MAWWKSVMFLADGRHGWEELFYQQADSLGVALQRLQALALLRAGITSRAVSIHKLRVSEVGVPRHTWDIAGPPGRGSAPAQAGTEGYMVRLAAGTRGLHRREYHLRGLPSDFFTGRSTIFPAYQPALTQYENALVDGTWYMKVNALLGPEVAVQEFGVYTLEGGNVLGLPVAGQRPLAGGTVYYAFTGRPPQPTASRVRVRAARVAPNTLRNRQQINGVFNIIDQDGFGVYWLGDVPLFDGISGGLVQLQGDTFLAIAEVTPRGRANRKTGPSPKGFGLARDQGTIAQAFGLGAGPGPAGPGPGQALTAWTWTTARTLANMQEAVVLCFEGYDSHAPLPLTPIAIAPLVDYPHTWLVSVAGVNRVAENNQTLWQGLLSGFDVLHAYRDDCVNAIGLTIPAGDKILWHGHSMGGIVGQNLAADKGFTGSWPITAVITWGSPTTAPESPDTVYLRFTEPADLVSVDVGALLTLKGRKQFDQFVCEKSSPDVTKFMQHNDYDKSPTLLQVKPWNGLGSGMPDDLLRLGPIKRFAAPHQD